MLEVLGNDALILFISVILIYRWCATKFWQSRVDKEPVKQIRGRFDLRSYLAGLFLGIEKFPVLLDDFSSFLCYNKED